MYLFVLWNSIVISFMLLFLISKKIDLKRSVFTIILFSLMTWFVFGDGIVKYVFTLDMEGEVHKADYLDVTIDSESNLVFNDFELIEPVSALDLNYQVHLEIDKPIYIVDYKNVNNYLVRFLTGWRKQIPIVTLYLPIDQIMNYDKESKKEKEEEKIDLFIDSPLELEIDVNNEGDIVDVKTSN